MILEGGSDARYVRTGHLVCVPLTSNVVWATAPGVALDRALLTERVGRLGPKQLAQILHGIDVVLGR